MKQFIGCDVHKRYSVFVSVDETGTASRAVRVAHEGGELAAYLSNLPAGTPVAVETTGHWYWLLDENREGWSGAASGARFGGQADDGEPEQNGQAGCPGASDAAA